MSYMPGLVAKQPLRFLDCSHHKRALKSDFLVRLLHKNESIQQISYLIHNYVVLLYKTKRTLDIQSYIYAVALDTFSRFKMHVMQLI